MRLGTVGMGFDSGICHQTAPAQLKSFLYGKKKEATEKRYKMISTVQRHCGGRYVGMHVLYSTHLLQNYKVDERFWVSALPPTRGPFSRAEKVVSPKPSVVRKGEGEEGR